MKLQINSVWGAVYFLLLVTALFSAFAAGACFFAPARSGAGPRMGAVLAAEKGTWLELRATPKNSIASREGLVYLMAEIKGEEDERFYCPARELWINGDRVETYESDCPAWEERDEFPRRFLYYLPRAQGNYEAEVRLMKAGNLVATAKIDWRVM